MGNKITRRRTVIDERYTRPQGLYPHRDVDQRKLRRLILESKLAPCFPGAEEPATDLEECPICFLHYPSVNRSKCCTKGICTECFLQMKSPHVARPTQCPFCKTPQYAVEYRGAKTLEEKGMEQAEEQKVIEAKIRMRQQELLDDEEREQRREENIRAGRIRLQTPRSQPVTNNEIASAPTDEINFLDWGYGDRQPQVLETLDSRESNAPRLNPYLWVEGDYRRSGGFDAAAPSQQPAEPNTVLALNQQQPEIGVPTLQAPAGAIRARHRDDDFDLGLEDIMVMEAIWLSIQEQGARHRFSDGEATRSVPNRPTGLALENSFSSEVDGTNTRSPPPPAVPEPEFWNQHSGRQGTVAVGLAGAIAALAEQQAVSPNTTHASHPTVTNIFQPSLSDDHSVPEISNMNEELLVSTGDAPDRQAHESSQRSEELPQRGRENGVQEMPLVASTSVRREAENSSRAFEKLANWVSSTQKEYKGSSMNTWLGDQSSEQVEVGTSFSSSVPSASELPWEAPDIPSDARNGESSGGSNNDKVLVPESFEEQMMLAMALSLADAQARVRHGGNHSGPLPQATHFTDAQARVRQGISRSGPLPRPTYIGQ